MDDFHALKIGDVGPVSKKPIKMIIVQNKGCIVFIDTDNEILYTTNDHYGEWIESPGEVLNQVGDLKALTTKVLRTEQDIYIYRCLIAKGLARLIENRDKQMAKKVLNEAEAKLTAIGKEQLRIAYLQSSFLTTVGVITFLIPLWFFRHNFVIHQNSFVLYGTICSLGGGLGAFLTTFYTAKKYNANIHVSKSVHVWDGFMRIFYGIIAGLIIYVGIRANLVLGFINNIDKNNFLLFFLSTLGGASELLLPSIIKQTEEKNLPSRLQE